MRVLVTGSAGHLARAVVPALCHAPRVTAVTGIDRVADAHAHPRYRSFVHDLRAGGLEERLRDHDALVHMAFAVQSDWLGAGRHDRRLRRVINVEAAQRLYACAADAGIRRFVQVSSASVYGPHPAQRLPITEDAPLRPIPGFAYAEDKAALEHWLDAFEHAHPHCTVVRLRPHVILGRNALPILKRLLRQPFYPALAKPHPKLQCVWEEDVARAVIAALFTDRPGAFNLAAMPAVSFRELLALRHRVTVPMPVGAADRLHRWLWKMTPQAGEPGWIAGLRHSLVLDCARARERLGWEATASVYDCVRRTLEAGGG